MDYELMMNGNVKIGQSAPDFDAVTTMGNISLSKYRGKWVVLFSHPGDFSPVCTTEMIAFSKANPYFQQLNACLLGLSIDSNPSHLAWMYDIYYKTGTVIPFPIIADRSGEIARKYGMISNNISNTSTARNVFIIDDKQIIRAILVYPMNIGRNIPEILRIVKALQTADANNQMAPANWMPCEPMVLPMPQTFSELQCRLKQIEKERNGMNWYLSLRNPENCNMSGIQSNNCNRVIDQRYNLISNEDFSNNIVSTYDFNSNYNFEKNRNFDYNQKKNENPVNNIDCSKKIEKNIDKNLNRNISNKSEQNLNQNLNNIVNDDAVRNIEKNKTIENNVAKNTNKTTERKNTTIQWKNFG